MKTQLDLDTSIFYSDDGLITIIYKDSMSMTNILDLFKQFGLVSGLKISPAKSKIIPKNFTFSKKKTLSTFKYTVSAVIISLIASLSLDTQSNHMTSYTVIKQNFSWLKARSLT